MGAFVSSRIPSVRSPGFPSRPSATARSSVPTPSDWHDRPVAGRDSAAGHLLPNDSLFLMGDPKMKRKGAAIAATVAGFLVGCGDSGPKLVPVTGTVTLNGKPLEGAVV